MKAVAMARSFLFFLPPKMVIYLTAKLLRSLYTTGDNEAD